jgi:DNA-directed RNA polymerase subunit N (RpoN/RPB10)
MIQPIRCFTCGKVVADQIDYYNRKKDELIKKNKDKDKEKIKHFSDNHTKEILDELGATRYCCRRMFISDVDMMNII